MNSSSRAARVLFVAATLLAVPAVSSAIAKSAPAATPRYALRLVSGTFHGPGALPDAPCPKGLLSHIEFERLLHGETRFFSNGPEAPNVPGQEETDGRTDGLMSDGTPFNEHAWGGIADVGGGAMRLMTVVSSRGPNHGREIYRLDQEFHLNITTDLALDPGFPEGIVVRENLRITTGVNWVPRSLQSEQGVPGGQDRAGSLPSGAPVVGRLGDFDRDGLLDGRIVGAANVPLGHMFSPGAPVLLERQFVSDIPIRPLDAALLTIANVTSYAAVWKAFNERRADPTDPAARYMAGQWPSFLRAIDEAWESAATLLEAAAAQPSTHTPATWLQRARDARGRLAEAQAWAGSASAQQPPAGVDQALRATFALAARLTTEMAPRSAFQAR